MKKKFHICYETMGNRNNPCIILVPGIGLQLIQWPIELTQGLVDKGFFVVVFDNRDSGLSKSYDELKGPTLAEGIALKNQGLPLTPPYTLDDMASDVIALLDELHIEKAHFLGASMGGIISQIAALKNPERMLSLTCLYTTSGEPTLPPAHPKVLEYFSSYFTDSKRQREDMALFISNKIELYKLYNPFDSIDEEYLTALFERSYLRGQNPAGFQRSLFAMICAEPRGEKLKKLKMKTLIIHGDRDPVFPIEHGRQLAECIPNSRLEIIEKLGHGLPSVHCDKIVYIIDNFIKS